MPLKRGENMTSLYELKGWRNAILCKIENGENYLDDTLESIECAIDEKLEGYGMIIRNLENKIEGCKEEEKRFKDKRTKAENAVIRLKAAIQDELLASGKQEINTRLFDFKIRRNPPAVHIQDEKLIPDYYFKTQKTVNKEALKKALKEMPVPGAELRSSVGVLIK